MRRLRQVTTAVIALTLALISSVALSAQNPGGNAEARKTKNPVAASAASVNAGKATFLKACRFCHGEDAKGGIGPQAKK